MATATRRRSVKAPDHEKVPLVRAGDLDVIAAIQRTPTTQRIKQLSGDNWVEEKRGILLVARITDTRHKGTLHIYDGGTRWRAAVKTHGPDYLFPVYILDMTYKEAAAAFMANNTDARLPSKYYQYLIGLECEPTLYPQYFAIRDAMSALGLEVGTHPTYGNGAPGVVAAVTACERIVSDWKKSLGTWEEASARLAEIIAYCREIYDYDGAHNADLMQAMSLLWVLNPDDFSRDSFRDSFRRKTEKYSVSQWSQKAKEAAESQGGSESRAVHLARRLARNYNLGRRSEKYMLVSPKVNDRNPEA